MSINKNTGSIISQQRAQELAKAFETKFPGQIVASFIGSNNVMNILNQTDCVGIRVYNGYNDATQKISMIMVGVDSAGGDILTNSVIYDDLAVCPPACPPKNASLL